MPERFRGDRWCAIQISQQRTRLKATGSEDQDQRIDQCCSRGLMARGQGQGFEPQGQGQGFEVRGQRQGLKSICILDNSW